MPQLPGGRHIAITANPLAELLDHADEMVNVPHVMAMKSPSDVRKYVAVNFLVPKDEAPDGDQPIVLIKGSNIPPEGLVMVDSGFRVTDWDALTANWTDEDKVVFKAFLDGPAHITFDNAWEAVESTRKSLLNNASMTTRLLAAWCAAGVHPCQEKGWEESDVGWTEWDTYDLLAALGQIRKLLPGCPKYSENWKTQARLDAFWQVNSARLVGLRDWPDPCLPVRECAAQARNGAWLDVLNEKKRQLIHNQAIIEIMDAWNALGDGFRAAMPQPYGIVELVIVSGEADCFFNEPSGEPASPN